MEAMEAVKSVKAVKAAGSDQPVASEQSDHVQQHVDSDMSEQPVSELAAQLAAELAAEQVSELSALLAKDPAWNTEAGQRLRRTKVESLLCDASSSPESLAAFCAHGGLAHMLAYLERRMPHCFTTVRRVLLLAFADPSLRPLFVKERAAKHACRLLGNGTIQSSSAMSLVLEYLKADPVAFVPQFVAAGGSALLSSRFAYDPRAQEIEHRVVEHGIWSMQSNR